MYCYLPTYIKLLALFAQVFSLCISTRANISKYIFKFENRPDHNVCETFSYPAEIVVKGKIIAPNPYAVHEPVLSAVLINYIRWRKKSMAAL